MTRTILLTAAVAALTAAVAPTSASADEPASSQGQISDDLLAQFGLGDSESVSDEEGEEIRGMGGRKKKKKLKQRYEVVVNRIKGKKRKIKKAVTKKNVIRLKRVKKGNYLVKYRAIIKNKKKTVSRSNYSPSNSFNIR